MEIENAMRRNIDMTNVTVSPPVREHQDEKSVIVELIVSPDGKTKIKTVHVKDAEP